MAGAQDSAAAVQNVLVQVPGLGVPAHFAERISNVVGGRQRVVVVAAEPVAPGLTQMPGEVKAHPGVAAGHQVVARVAGHPAQIVVAGGGQVGGQQVRHQHGPCRPGDRVTRAAGVAGSQDGFAAVAGGGGLRGGEPVAEDGLVEPVQHEPALVDPRQRLPGQLGQGLPPGQRIGGPGRQVAGQLAGGAGEQVLGNGLRGEERAHAGQLSGGRIITVEPVSDQLCRSGQPPRVGPRHPLSQQPPGLGAQQPQVLRGRHAGLRHEPGGLRDGQRQVAQLAGEPVRIGRTESRDPALQDRHRFRPRQHVHLDRRSDLRPITFP